MLPEIILVFLLDFLLLPGTTGVMLPLPPRLKTYLSPESLVTEVHIQAANSNL